jgi:hypothetical protein
MIIIFIIIGILLLVFGAWMENEYNEILGGICCAFGLVDLFVSCITFVCLCVCLSDAHLAGEKIAMYTEENEKIELQISEAIKEYQQYEGEVFERVTPENAVTLVTVYPELKTDALVQKQIEVYLSNNEKLKELKVTKIEEKVYRWWLYFGGGSDE